MNSRIVSAFRIVAFAEALTWLGLLIGMFFKYVPESGEAGVKIFGPIHGGMFLLYVVLTIATARAQRWSMATTIVALGASIPPFFTAWFERWAKNSGRLEPDAESALTAAR
jgi:integral membrane protein